MSVGETGSQARRIGAQRLAEIVVAVLLVVAVIAFLARVGTGRIESGSEPTAASSGDRPSPAVSRPVSLLAGVEAATTDDPTDPSEASQRATGPWIPLSRSDATVPDPPPDPDDDPDPVVDEELGDGDVDHNPGGLRDRGRLLPAGTTGRFRGSLAPGATDVWQVEIRAGQSLAIASGGLGGAVLTLEDLGGAPLEADFAGDGLVVFTTPGLHVVELANAEGAEGPATYTVGAGLSGPDGGFHTGVAEIGVELGTLDRISCSVSTDRMIAGLVPSVGGGQGLLVTVGGGDGPDTIAWPVAVGVTATIDEIAALSTGLASSATVGAGPDSALGRSFWLTVHGCHEGYASP